MNNIIDLRNDPRFDELLAAYGDSFASLSGSINPDPLIEYIESVYAPLAAAVPAEEADECAANMNGHKFDSFGPQGEVQCEWCGEMRDTPAEPAPIQASAEDWEDRYNTGVKPWSFRIPSNSRIDLIETAMQAEINELRAIVAAARLSKSTAQGAANRPNADCSGEPSNCPDNEGYGCECNQSPAQVTGEPASIDTPEFHVFMNEYDNEASYGSINKARIDLVNFINRHIAAQATAGRDAVLEEAAQVLDTMPRSDASHKPLTVAAKAIRALKSHAAEQSSGGAK